MNGKDLFLEMIAEDDDILADIAENQIGCPSGEGLEDHCQRSCINCWYKALEEKHL